MHSANPADVATGAALVALFFLILGPVLGLTYLGLLIFSAVKCAKCCPEKDRIAWLLIAIFVPFGWLLYLTVGPKNRTEGRMMPISPPPLLVRSPTFSVDEDARRVAEKVRRSLERRP